MTSDLKNIWTSTNKVLTTINLYLFAFIKSGIVTTVKVNDANTKRIPLVYNILLLILLGTICYLLISMLFGRRLTIN